MIPKYIDKKIDRLNSMLDQAYLLKAEIEDWVESKGIDTYDTEWHKHVIDESSAVNGICKESLHEYIESLTLKEYKKG
ncbi:MAG: hypothetical protein K1W35_12945 [Lachnospiraceae bacterium]